MEQNKIKLTKRMLPFLMKPYILIILIIACIIGEIMWLYIAIKNGHYWEFIGMFMVGFFLGFVNGRWTSELWDKHFIQSLLKGLKVSRTPIGRKNAILTYLALGVPMLLSFFLSSYNPFTSSLQSYIFAFICGMNIAIYRWARKLPNQ